MLICVTQRGLNLPDDAIEAGCLLMEHGGVSGMTLKRVAVELGCSVEHLMRYYPNKDSLLLDLLDEVHGQFNIPQYAGSPRDHLYLLFLGMREHLEKYPWVLQIAQEGKLYSSWLMYFAEEVLVTFGRAGIRGMPAYLGYRTLWFHLMGYECFRVDLDDRKRRVQREIAMRVDPQDVPLLYALFPQIASLDKDCPYHIALDMMLDSLIGQSWAKYDNVGVVQESPEQAAPVAVVARFPRAAS